MKMPRTPRPCLDLRNFRNVEMYECKNARMRSNVAERMKNEQFKKRMEINSGSHSHYIYIYIYIQAKTSKYE
jgi:hypothetical protein